MYESQGIGHNSLRSVYPRGHLTSSCYTGSISDDEKFVAGTYFDTKCEHRLEATLFSEVKPCICQAPFQSDVINATVEKIPDAI